MTCWHAIPDLGGRDVGPFRIGGPGLGNLLFPWARAEAAARTHGGQVVWPAWTALKPLRLLRLDRDQRWYGGLFRRPPSALGGLRGLGMRLAREDHVVAHNQPLPCFATGHRYRFTGIETLFEPLWTHRSLIRDAFFEMCRYPPLRTSSGLLAVHVRLGDFRRVPPRTPSPTDIATPCLAQPLEWFIRAVAAARSRLGSSVPAVIFSDGTPEEISPLLAAIPAARRADPADPVAHLTAMACSSAIVASQSTFSMWAAFLSPHDTPVFGPGAPLPETWGSDTDYQSVP